MAPMVRDILELASSLGFLDEISEEFHRQPDTIDPSWQALLTEAGRGVTARAATNGEVHGAAASSGRGNGQATNGQATNGQAMNGQATNGQAAANGQAATALAIEPRGPSGARPGVVTLSPIAAQTLPTVWPLINAYRSRGHFNAKLDPLGLLETARIVELDPATWGFTAHDFARMIDPTGVHGLPRATLGEILAQLRQVYASTVGLEFMHITSPARRSWLAERMETQLRVPLPADLRIRILGQLNNAEQF